MKYSIIIGNNFEDVEAITQIDILRRAGITIDIYGAGNDKIRSRSNIIYQADKVFNKESDMDTGQYDGILIPGGPGVDELVKNEALLKTVKRFFDSGKLVFAICAGPRVLDKAGILKGKRYTSYPDTVIENGTWLDEKVVIDANIITSQGVGTSLEAAIKLVEIIHSKAEADQQAKKVLYNQ